MNTFPRTPAGPGSRARRVPAAWPLLSALPLFLLGTFPVPAAAGAAAAVAGGATRAAALRGVTADDPSGGTVALRPGAREVEYVRIPNGIARASSSGDNRPPANAFDRKLTTFWRNRTNQTGTQYLEMDFGGLRHTVRRMSLTFGNHHPRDYRFRIRRNGVWGWNRAIAGNTLAARRHVWLVPLQGVQAVRIYCLRYSLDDYFSIREMVIEK